MQAPGGGLKSAVSGTRYSSSQRQRAAGHKGRGTVGARVPTVRQERTSGMSAGLRCGLVAGSQSRSLIAISTSKASAPLLVPASCQVRSRSPGLPSQCGRLSPRAALPAGSRRVLRKVRDGTRCRQRVTGGQNGLRWLHSESPARRGARELTFRCVSREQADRTRPQKIQRGQRGDRRGQSCLSGGDNCRRRCRVDAR